MRKVVLLVLQRSVPCPTCDAKVGDPCHSITFGREWCIPVAQKYNHVCRVRKYEREKDSLPTGTSTP